MRWAAHIARMGEMKNNAIKLISQEEDVSEWEFVCVWTSTGSR